MPKDMQPTDRDLAYWIELAEVRFMDTPLARERHYHTGKTDRFCLKRHNEFIEAGYLARTCITINDGTGAKKSPTVYYITEKTVEELLKHGCPVRRPPPSPPKPARLHHTLSVIRPILFFKDAARAAGIPFDFILEQDTCSNSQPDDPAHRRYVLYQAWGHGDTRVTCRPDACIFLQLPDGSQYVLLIESDTGSSSETLKQAADEKAPGYQTFLHDKPKHWRRLWPERIDPNAGLDLARVLYITSSAERRDHLCERLRRWPVAQKFRFAVRDELNAGSILTSPVWLTIDGELKAVLPSTETPSS
jgi:hypothetical protein